MRVEGSGCRVDRYRAVVPLVEDLHLDIWFVQSSLDSGLVEDVAGCRQEAAST